MRTNLKLAAPLLVIGIATAHAQISNPDNLVAPPPALRAHPRPAISDNLQWIWTFARPTPVGRADELRLDERFQSVLPREFKQPQAMWGDQPDHKPALASIIPLFITRYGSVSATGNRYISVDGCVPSFCSAAGMLWIDLGAQQPLMVFTATNWIAKSAAANDPGAAYEMWLFPNRNLDPKALPLALTNSIVEWNGRLAAAHRLVPHISQALLVEPDGTPYALDPELAGANIIAPQPDTVTPPPATN